MKILKKLTICIVAAVCYNANTESKLLNSLSDINLKSLSTIALAEGEVYGQPDPTETADYRYPAYTDNSDGDTYYLYIPEENVDDFFDDFENCEDCKDNNYYIYVI